MDFRLKVFHSVATNLSFTKASKELFISQPAISKHIHELEVQYKTPLFDRVGSHIGLTHAGELLLSHTKQLLAAYRQMDFEMNLLTDNFAGELRLGASTWRIRAVHWRPMTRFRSNSSVRCLLSCAKTVRERWMWWKLPWRNIR